jgi:hypothetical protein
MNILNWHKIFLFFSSFFLSKAILACMCYGPDKFDLLTYDTYNYIFEVTVNSIYEPQQDSLPQDTLRPPSLFFHNLVNGYEITIKEVYKGDVDPHLKFMGFPKGSSCSWTPEIGYTYIFYADWINGIEMCNRKVVLDYNQEAFETEKKILRILKESPEVLAINDGERKVLTGKNDKGLRVGTWYIYSLTESNEIVFELDYENGKLMGFRTGPGYNELEHWLYIVRREYQEQVLEGKD